MTENNKFRDEFGALTGDLIVEEYVQGIEDNGGGIAPPDLTSPSYDLGRQRGAENRADLGACKEMIKSEHERRAQAMKAFLSPAAFEAYQREIEAIWRKR